MRLCHSWIDQNASKHDEKESAVKIAILDDYQNVALQFADWSRVASKADITVFNQAVIGPLTRFGERSPPLCMPTWC